MLKNLILSVALVLAPLSVSAEVEVGEDGLHKPEWIRETFLDMREDREEAESLGLRLVIIIEQRGCIYCTKMHNEVFPTPEIDAHIRENFFVVQLNMFGDLEVTDFDGEVLAERDIVKKWGVFFTPTMLFMPTEDPGEVSASAAAVAVMPGAFSKGMTGDMFEWVTQEGFNTDEHFQKFHARMIDLRRNQ